jgi:hypothetical protein
MEKTEQTEVSPFAVQGVLAALKEVQDTVRAYDTKAQIVGVGFIFSIGIITGFGERLPAVADFSALLVALFWIFAIGPVVLFGLVLYPSRAIAPHLETEANSIRHTYYFRPTESRGLNSFVQDLKASDWLKEIGYEIMKQSGLRELKRHRFLRALWAAGVTYIVAATIQILRSMEAFPLR